MSSLFKNDQASSGPVECLGQTFPNEEARREHFQAILREKLKDPEFRKIEGFPIGSDEDILALSNPPYYTACPNPFISEFVMQNMNNEMHDTILPYAGDLTADSRHPVYSFHPYHTKVPPEIIKKLVNHYTKPGDFVVDAFCGTGMTGVAAREAGRFSIVVDLSPVATFISSVNVHSNPAELAAENLNRMISESKKTLGWVYQTKENEKVVDVNYFVWSDVFTCPECVAEFPFFPHGVIHHGNKVETKKSFPCPECGADLNVRKIERVKLSTGKKKALAWVNAGTGRNRINRGPSEFDKEIVNKLQNQNSGIWYPTDTIDPDGYSAKLAQLGNKEITNISRFLTERNLLVFSDLWKRASEVDNVDVRNLIKSCLTSIFTVVSERQGYFGGGGGMSGNLYMPIVRMEKNIYDSLERKINKMYEAEHSKQKNYIDCLVSCQSSTNLAGIPSASIDYIYTDPPFGANIIYSEMNLLIEGWLKVRSKEGPEAVINETKNKKFDDYGLLMRKVFHEYYRILKPGKWITIEFHNTMASVWNLIQTNLAEVGFVVAQVGKLDKGSTTILADIRPGAVVQDLIISAYKPNGGLEDRFIKAAGNEDSAWDFVRTHLKYIPSVKIKDGELEYITERDPRIIFDRLVAWFVRHNFPVPLSNQEFQAGLSQRFSDRDGMVFLPDQVTEYDRRRMKAMRAPQMEMFISDERSAIDWLSDFLKRKPATYSEIHPEFIRQLGAGWKKFEAKPELTTLLESNFLTYDPKDKDSNEVPSQIHSYLSTNWSEYRNLEKSDPRLKAKAADRWYVPDPNKAQELEKLREKSLLKEFEIYKTSTLRKLKEFRLEAVRAGFKFCWGNRDYATIMAVAKKIPDDVLQEDEKLLLWYDQAVTRMEDSI